MSNILEVEDKTNRTIYLSDERWKHIVREHPDLSRKVNEVEETIRYPLIIKESIRRKNIAFYYKYYKHLKQKAK